MISKVQYPENSIDPLKVNRSFVSFLSWKIYLSEFRLLKFRIDRKELFIFLKIFVYQ